MAIRVLLADDVEEIRELMRVNLEIDGRFEVVAEAGDGSQAVSLSTHARPHVEISDLAMPKLAGVDMIRGLREARPDVKIVVFSAFLRELSLQALEAGADICLEKTVHSIDDVVAAAARLGSSVADDEVA